MPRFMMFIYPVISDEEYAEGPSVEDVEAMTRYNEELTKAGAARVVEPHELRAAILDPPSPALDLARELRAAPPPLTALRR